MPGGFIQRRAAPAAGAAARAATAVAVTWVVMGAGTDYSRKRTITCISGECDDDVIGEAEKGYYYGFRDISKYEQ